MSPNRRTFKRQRVRATSAIAALAACAAVAVLMGIESGSAVGSPSTCPAGSTLAAPTSGGGPAQCVIAIWDYEVEND